MLFLTSLLAVTCVLCRGQEMEEIAKYRKECNDTYPVDERTVEYFNTHNHKLPVDKTFTNLKCWSFCFYKKLGILNETGDLQMNVRMSYMESNNTIRATTSNIKNLTSICISHEPKICLKAFEVLRCYFKNILKNFLSATEPDDTK